MPDIKGRVIDAGNSPIAGLNVQVWQFDRQYGLIPLPGSAAATDAAGQFNIPLTKVGLLMTAGQPLQVRIRNEVGRLLFKSAVRFLTVGDADWEVGDVTLATNTLSGWRITNLQPNGQQALFSEKNFVAPLIDNQIAWKEVEASVKAATNEITLQLFYFDIRLFFLTFTPDPPSIGVPTVGGRLEDLLLAADRGTPHVAIRLMIREARDPTSLLSLPYPSHTAKPVAQFFQAATPNSVSVRKYATDFRFPMHAKMMTFDANVAHIIGSPFLQEYFDAQTHQVVDPRRGHLSGLPDYFSRNPLKGIKNSIRSPVHDVGLKIVGPAVGFIRETFFDHWDLVGPPEGTPVTPPDAPAPNAAVQIARSLPGSTFPGKADGEAGVLEAYQRAFFEAEDFVYLENQYFHYHEIIDGIRLALRRAVRRGKPLQFIILVNHAVDLPGYNVLQATWLRRLQDALKADGNQDRVGIFTLWTHESSFPKDRIIRIYVHTKAGLADDKWATVGSANLDGASLQTGEYARAVVLEADEHQRATEANALIFNGIDGMPSSDVPRSLRIRLWSEHLGLAETDPQLSNRPAGGWLQLWKERAQRKLDSLNAVPAQVISSRILPWIPQPDAENFLKKSGVDPSRFNVLSEVRSFDFQTGTFETGFFE